VFAIAVAALSPALAAGDDPASATVELKKGESAGCARVSRAVNGDEPVARAEAGECEAIQPFQHRCLPVVCTFRDFLTISMSDPLRA
jgi:hypothetical protein